MIVGYKIDTKEVLYWWNELGRIPKYLYRVPWYYKPLWILLSVIQICLAFALLLFSVTVFASAFTLCSCTNLIAKSLKFMCKGALNG